LKPTKRAKILGISEVATRIVVLVCYSKVRRQGFSEFRAAEPKSQNGFSNAPEIALVYVGLDQKDQAMGWLEKAFEERFSPWVLMRPAFDPLRSDPRFQDLLHRIGLNK
jgi:hypothetical protein